MSNKTPVTNQAAAGAPETSQAAAAASVAAAADQAKHEPALTPPQADPVVPRDQFHGQGGVYAVIDGKRVKVDEDGKPVKPPKA